MSLITRLSRLLQADLHAVLDRVEEPEALLQQSIREMEESLADETRRAEVLKHQREQIVARQEQLTRTLAGIEQQLDTSFHAGDDTLSRKLIKRKLEAQRFASYLSQQHKTVEDSYSNIAQCLDEDRDRLDSMRQKAELLGQKATSVEPANDWNELAFAVREEDVEVTFLQEKQRRSRS